jgi:hypothetical protein
MSERSELIIKRSAFLCLIRARSEVRTWMSSTGLCEERTFHG